MKHFLLACCCFSLQIADAVAQRACAAPEYLKEAGISQSSLRKPAIKSHSKVQSHSNDQPEIPVIKIPVVVHVVYNTEQQNISEAQIRSQIEVLNKDFRKLNPDTIYIPDAFRAVAADCRIEFHLASSDPEGRATSGIIRKATNIRAFGINDDMKFSKLGGSDAWDPASYLNIWVAPLTRGQVGFSSAPGLRSELDGVVIAYNAFGTNGTAQPPYNRGRTATHEIGHWLGLKHIWGDTDCGNDFIDDTPPQSGSTKGCPSGVVTTCDNGPNGNMYMNFMDYTDDACISMFTLGQADYMRGLLEENGHRNSLTRSKGLSAPVLPALQEENPSVTAVKLFPNPARSFVKVDSDEALEGQPVVIRNYAGQVLLHTSVSGGKIMVSNLKSGLYFVAVGRSKVMKLFVQ